MTSAPTPPRVRSIRWLGYAPTTSGDAMALVGQDGGQSIPLGDNRSLFLFSDTLLARGEARHLPRSQLEPQSAHFLANCAATCEGESLQHAYGNLSYLEDPDGVPREILAPTPLERLDSLRFWPQHGIVCSESVYLYFLGIQQFDQSSTWGFRPVGSGIAKLDLTTGEAERIESQTGWCIWPGDDGDQRQGVSVLRRDGYAYIYGSNRRDMISYATLARVPESRISDVDAYEYLMSSEPDWSTMPSDSTRLTACSAEYSVTFNGYLEQYLMIYVDHYKNSLMCRTACEPWGPFSAPVNAGTLPKKDRTDLISLGFEHPQFAQEDGKKIYISYCQPNFTQNALVALTFA